MHPRRTRHRRDLRASTLVPPSIAPVPPEQGTLSALDIGVLWNDLSLGLLVLVTGRSSSLRSGSRRRSRQSSWEA